jgi:hypothetical protein
LQHTTAYEYDAFERMLKSTLPDQTVVERRYALHSTEDLPVWIGVNDRELGQQAFDGLDRMHTSITGGRVTTYRFNPGQSQPCKVIRPSLEQIDYDYLPALGEDPLKRTLASPGTAATYDYDEKNARLRSSEENGLTLSREYFSTGEIKSETRQEGAGGALTMFYDYRFTDGACASDAGRFCASSTPANEGHKCRRPRITVSTARRNCSIGLRLSNRPFTPVLSKACNNEGLRSMVMTISGM